MGPSYRVKKWSGITRVSGIFYTTSCRASPPAADLRDNRQSRNSERCTHRTRFEFIFDFFRFVSSFDRCRGVAALVRFLCVSGCRRRRCSLPLAVRPAVTLSPPCRPSTPPRAPLVRYTLYTCSPGPVRRVSNPKFLTDNPIRHSYRAA